LKRRNYPGRHPRDIPGCRRRYRGWSVWRGRDIVRRRLPGLNRGIPPEKDAFQMPPVDNFLELFNQLGEERPGSLLFDLSEHLLNTLALG
jgi:hypothetical protein